ncbi:ATP-binding cassette domain-containing protein [Candidatus Enterococcus murrayae]|uniref:ATP-binding cassette domain-containing protein n=1 Tax=Candidatus Enterococcus murrayae TaxID=2815321 RepID=A0ABS3HFX2_9ENTE|nr:ATP-binding cassette domain-containing protein [Enterococcus sp. MJM16]MBO0452349.1 ATP-binding cassette domain-containing protein [Enterococcus sp. MJM16]
MTEWVLKNVEYRYERSEIKTLDGIHGSFQTGKSYQIFGNPGSGKSTLLALFAGLAVCTKGSLTVSGQEIASLERNIYRGRETACIFQAGSLLKDSPLANLEMEVLLSGAKLEKERLKRILLAVGLAENQLKTPTNRLSEKNRQLVALAKLLAKQHAKLILIDEPEKVFSECGVPVAMELLRNHCLQQEKCLIFTTQSTQSVQFADELWGLNGGKLLFIKEQHP